MTELTDEQKTEYFRRSYTAVDGLWFMKVEEKHGFEEALRLDEAVWKVLPKIQARTLKGMMNLPGGLEGLQQALSVRLALEGFDYEMKPQDNGFAVIIKRCPWHDIMKKSGRGNLSERVSDLICRVENSMWASEFSGAEEKGEACEGEGREIGFEREARICRGEDRCMLKFLKIDFEGPHQGE
ncbi:MAG: L-2-amino-thiazoline-4-carboxylic acid hydrolase [Methanotrichaceae archaeon]|nr:L-2-amino-thiazoline-4-carboxylic acid hydrolase [Methanotrichaceae archaeon]